MTDQPTAPYVTPSYAGAHRPPCREEDPLFGCLLSTLLLGPVIAVDLGIVWWQWESTTDLNHWLRTAIWAIAPLLFAAVVLIRGRRLWRGLLGALIALAAALSGLLLNVLINLQNDDVIDPLSPGQIDRIADVTSYLSVGLMVLAWGVARRRGLLWLVGLLPVAPLVWGAGRIADEVFAQADGLTVWLGLTSVAVYTGATLIAGVACWLLDVLQRLILPARSTVSTA